MKKKLWCVLCIVTCVLLIAACGQKKESGKEKTEKAEQAETKFKDRESLEMSLLTDTAFRFSILDRHISSLMVA